MEFNQNLRRVTISTPYPLKDREKQLFYHHFPYLKNATVENKVDKNLIGGFVIKFGTTMFDASIKGAINRLVKRFYESG